MKTILLIISTMIIFSCSKDDDIVIPTKPLGVVTVEAIIENENCPETRDKKSSYHLEYIHNGKSESRTFEIGFVNSFESGRYDITGFEIRSSTGKVLYHKPKTAPGHVFYVCDGCWTELFIKTTCI